METTSSTPCSTLFILFSKPAHHRVLWRRAKARHADRRIAKHARIHRRVQKRRVQLPAREYLTAGRLRRLVIRLRRLIN
eukprot:16237160-Heterocapsa_arctica.AAC.1